ncbi:Hypothetical protein R9X50_00451200 [Acrodontium crateriforme]|uniref:Crh-like protein n=1 Tax=Acrodontium crateriforme TaxID=150365 RepID=A0AAQ3M4F4_9PEZI|nr:Hypothetical protein R9X50_00451200 [Acrodontium crateriforme]
MKTTTFNVAAALAATFALHVAADAIKCGDGAVCPSDAPCCSEYGQCGVGAYCLGGCDPKHSFDLQSCVAAPVCQSTDYTMNSMDDIMPNTEYLGDASKANWVSSGNPAIYNNEALLLTMPPDTVGTLVTSTHYVWYGKVSASLTTSQGQGVVTAFILMSDMKDEIDFEFVGTDIQTAQSNYYFQGITDYHNEKNLSASDTVQNTHKYEFDWTPDTLTWSIDGQAMRVLNRNDTYNSTTGQYHYPQTPARIQLSLWPAGLSTNGAGTIAWAGGLVNWNSPYMQNGYYYAKIDDVSVECYDPPSGFSNNYGNKAYYYNNLAGTNNTVCIGDNSTTLASFYATGDDPNTNPNAQSSGTKSSAPTSTPETVPGISGGGVRGTNGDDSSGTSSASGSEPSTTTNTGGGQTGFTQGGSTGQSGASKVVAGSAVALLGFFIAALML